MALLADKSLRRVGVAALLGFAVFVQSPWAWQRIAAQDTSAIQYSGRIAWTMAGHAGMSWPGTSATLRFNGTSCRAVFKPKGGLYRVFIDGQAIEASTLSASPHDTLLWLAQGLTPGPHTVTVYKRTEAAIGIGVFVGFEIEGISQPPTPPPPHRLEFIGGAETCGDGILDSLPSSSPFPSAEDQYLTYAALTSRALGAEGHSLCWSGIGLHRNTGGDTLTTMPSLYTRVDPTQPNRDHDFSWKPDAIIINLGAHDFSNGLPLDSARFVSTLIQFLRHIHTRQPQSRFVLVDGPLQPNDLPCAEGDSLPCASSLTRLRSYNAAAALSWNTQFPGMVSTLSLTPMAITMSLSASNSSRVYPNVAHHDLNARELIGHLSGQFNWAATQPLISAPKQNRFPSRFPSRIPLNGRKSPGPSLWILLGRQF